MSDSLIPGRTARTTSSAPCSHPGARLLVERRLERSGYSALRRIRCECHDGVLRLTGSVPSFYLKQVALAVVADVEDVRAFRVEIEVRRPGSAGVSGRYALTG